MRFHLLPWVMVVYVIGCDHSQMPTPPKTPAPSKPTVASAAPEPGPVRFEQVVNSGLDFVYYGNPNPRHHMTEQNGGGVALFDFDLDGWCDVFLANGSDFSHPAEQHGAVHMLARNISPNSRGMRFQNVSSSSGLAVSGFGMGVAAGDFNNDGFADLFICYYGRIELWQNQGDGTFENVTERARLADSSWSAGAAFADLDDDGDLDLYVTNYVVYSPRDPPCFTQHQQPVQISCGPIGRTAQPDTLWENRGDGTFQDASERSGIRSVKPGKGLAVEIVDLNGDQRLDIYVANDTDPNFLFLNQGDLTFTEQGILWGAAVQEDGSAGSSMGIACADFDANGLFDLFVTNFENAANDFYDHVSPTAFLHQSAARGLDAASRPMLAFGTVAADFDLDQWPDLFVANGHIWDLTSLGFGHQYAMPPQLFWNDQGRRFQDVSRKSGDYFEDQWLGRAAAAGDLDQDGRVDLVITHLIRPAAIVRNVSPPRGNSVRVRLIGTSAPRTPLGITLRYRCGQVTRLTHIPSGGSFAASHVPDCVLSTGTANTVDELEVQWTAHHVELWRNVHTTGAMTLVEGTGEPSPRQNGKQVE